jgi:hypothetical protein
VAYRVVSVLPFLAAWTAACYALGRRLLPVMAPGGSSTPAPRLHSRGVQVQDLPELGTVDGIADLGFALAAWFIDPDYNWIGLLQLK